MSTSGTGEEPTEAGACNSAGNGAGNDIDNERVIVLKTVTRCCGKKIWNRLKKCDIYRKYIPIQGL